MISVCKLFNVKSSTETVSRKSMNNFKDPPKLICSLASSMLLLVMKLADWLLLLGQWKSVLEAVSPQLRKTERDASLFCCWKDYHSALVVVRLISIDKDEKKGSVFMGNFGMILRFWCH